MSVDDEFDVPRFFTVLVNAEVCWCLGSAVRTGWMHLTDFWDNVDSWWATDTFEVVLFATSSALLPFCWTHCPSVVMTSTIGTGFAFISPFVVKVLVSGSSPRASVTTTLRSHQQLRQHWHHWNACSLSWAWPVQTVKSVVLLPLRWGSPVVKASQTVCSHTHLAPVYFECFLFSVWEICTVCIHADLAPVCLKRFLLCFGSLYSLRMCFGVSIR